MMRLLALLLMTAFLCASCTALPAEERAFAVTLCVERQDGVWQVHGRIPTYQTGGGYLTVSGEGDSIAAALSAMEAAAPMRVSLSQLRMLVLDETLAGGGLASALSELADIPDMRLQCAVALTETPVKDVAEALKPATGARLSKSIDVLLESRIEQGAVLPAELADVIRMGERQSAVLMALSVEDKRITLSGGYALDGAMALVHQLSAEETALLSLLLEKTKMLHLSLPEGSVQVREINVRTNLSQGAAGVEIGLHCISSGLTADALEQSLAVQCVELLSRLSTQGCDVLGLGRKAIVRAEEMSSWHALDWPSRLRELQWTVSVHAEGRV